MSASRRPDRATFEADLRAARGPSDTLPEPEMGLAVALACARSEAERDRPSARPGSDDRITSRYGEIERIALRDTVVALRARGAPATRSAVPPSLVARRSFGPPLPRHDPDE